MEILHLNHLPVLDKMMQIITVFICFILLQNCKIDDYITHQHQALVEAVMAACPAEGHLVMMLLIAVLHAYTVTKARVSLSPSLSFLSHYSPSSPAQMMVVYSL